MFSLALSPGPVVFGSLGLFAARFQEQFGWSRLEFMTGLTLFNLAGMLSAPLTGRLLDRFGVRPVLLPSLVLLALGFVVTGLLVKGLAVFYAVTFLWGATTVGTQGLSYNQVLTTWFQRHRGKAVGLANAGIGVGYLIVPTIVAWLLARFEWHVALAALGLMIVVGPLAVDAIWLHPNRGAAASGGRVAGASFGEAARSREFALMVSAILLASTALSGVVPNIAQIVRDQGLPESRAFLAASAYGLCTIAGRLMTGWLADRFYIAHIAGVLFALAAGGLLCAGVSDFGQVSLVVLLAGVGLSFGAESDVIPLLVAHHFGQRSFGAVYGSLFAAFLTGAAAGPAIFGFARDRFGSYTLIERSAGVAVLVAAILVLCLRRSAPRRGATV